MYSGNNVAFSDREKELIDQVAQERGISFDEAANQVAAEELARRIKRSSGHNPAANVRNFRR